MITIGSTALKYHKVNIGREPSDHDVLTTTEWERYYKVLGCDTIVVPKKIIDLVPHIDDYATPDAVLTLKASSLGWDIHWDKHKRDVLSLKAQGYKIIPYLYTALTDYWKETNGNKPFLDFYKTKSDFFNDYVEYHYEHDYLHEVLAYPNEPLYLFLLEEGQEVAIDRYKFEALPFDLKIQLFKEEMGVIAAERWLIPPKLAGKYTWSQAYLFALKKMLVSLTKDWQTDFIIYNLDKFAKPDYNLFSNFIKQGIITMNKVENTEEFFKELLMGVDQEIRDDYSYDAALLFHEEITNPNYEFIEQVGGSEGDGEYCHVVFKWKDNYYKICGTYQSFNGVEVHPEVYIVNPQQKVITVYE